MFHLINELALPAFAFDLQLPVNDSDLEHRQPSMCAGQQDFLGHFG